MQNLDTLAKIRQDNINAIVEAVKSGEEGKLEKAFSDYGEQLQAHIMELAVSTASNVDATILASRGQRVYTSAEVNFGKNVIAAMKTGQPLAAITNLELAFPEETIETVLETVKTRHPLLSRINLRNTKALTKWIIDDSTSGRALWDALGAAITQEATGAITVVNLTTCKLTAFTKISNDFLDLGPSWVLTYLIELLTEYIANGLEYGIVDGTGKNMPIGMTRNISNLGTTTDGEYARKEAIAVTELSALTYGTLLSTLTTDRKGNERDVDDLIMVVNPKDYFTVVFPATTIRRPDNTYANDVLPYPTEIIKSRYAPEGHAILGIAPNYFMGIGAGTNGGRIEDDEGKSKFLEDVRQYKIKLYGNGMAKDNNSFLYLDITNLQPTYLTVNTIDVTPAAGE